MRGSGLADVLADRHQRCATRAAVARLRFVARLDGRQVGRQCAALGRLARRRDRCGRRAAQRLQLALDRRDVRGHALVEQRALVRIHALGLRRELHAAQARDLVGQHLDPRFLVDNRAIARGNRCIALGDRIDLFADHATQGIDVSDRGEGGGVHAVIIAV